MLNKTDDLKVDPSAPWAGDLFKRKDSGELLSRLIRSLRKSYVISIRGDWGSGKSVFLQRLRAHLDQEGVRTIYVDAWKSDYLEDPLLAFVSATNARLQTFSKENPDEAVKIGQLITALAHSGVKLVAPTAKMLAAMFAPGSDKVIEAASEVVRDFGNEFLSVQKQQHTVEDEFRDKLEEARDILTKRNSSRPISQQIVVIIDELDRCRPDYAVKLLERIKHFFSIPGVVFVLATDPSNLPNAIGAVYGEKTDGDLYLRKFIDFEFDLPKPTPITFIDHLVEQFELSSLCEIIPRETLYQNRNGSSINGYQHMYQNDRRTVDVSETVECFPHFADELKLSLRDQAQAFTVLNAYLRSVRTEVIIFPYVLTFAVALRFSVPIAYRKLKSGELSLSDVLALRDPLLKESSLMKAVMAGSSYLPDLRAFALVEDSKDDPQRALAVGLGRKLDSEDDWIMRGAFVKLKCRAAKKPAIITSYLERALSLADAFVADPSP